MTILEDDLKNKDEPLDEVNLKDEDEPKMIMVTKRKMTSKITTIPKIKTFSKMIVNTKIPQSGICPAPCALRQCTVVLHENVVFSIRARMCNAAYSIFVMWNYIHGLDACYHFRLNISCGVAVTVRRHQKNIR